jgi:nitrite reductase/ring-hydroxylating ferredoxin subunit
MSDAQTHAATDSCHSCLSRRAVLAGAGAAAAVVAAPLEQASALAPVPAQDLGPASSVPVGGGRLFTVNGRPVMVTQPKKGKYKAFSGVCTHQGCTVSGTVKKNRITCPCHDSVFSAANGKVLSGPARRALVPVKIRVRKGRLMAVMTVAAPAATSPTPSPTASTAGGGGDLPAGYALLTGTVPADGGVAVLTAGGKLVLVHRTGASIRTYRAACPHQFATQLWNTTLVNGAIRCNNHFYAFDPLTGAGRGNGLSLTTVANIPAGNTWAVDTRQL